MLALNVDVKFCPWSAAKNVWMTVIIAMPLPLGAVNERAAPPWPSGDGSASSRTATALTVVETAALTMGCGKPNTKSVTTSPPRDCA